MIAYDVTVMTSIVFLLTSARSVATDKVKYDISWNPEVTEKLAKGKVFTHPVTIGEYMDIICPQYDVDENRDKMMTFVIYNVTQDTFDNCGSKNPEAEKLLDCHQPTKNMKLTLKFQSFSPNPRGFIYRPGEKYYLMAYDNDEAARNSGPDCSDKMRMRIIVHPKRHHHPKVPQTKPVSTSTSTTTTTTVTSAKFRSSPPTTTTTSTSTTSTTSTSNDIQNDEAREDKEVDVKTAGSSEKISGHNSSTRMTSRANIAYVITFVVMLWLT